jgi:hypothetical protein
MQTTRKPVSKIKVVLLWAVLLGNLFFWCGFWLWREHGQTPPPSQEEGSELFQSIALLVCAMFFLVTGVGSYFLLIATSCLTFNFRNPVFGSYKGKLYLAKIAVPTLTSLGVGFILAVVVAPLLKRFGVSGGGTYLLPLFAVLIPMQIAQMWVSIWALITKRLITRRLLAQGITAAQLQSAMLIGISDPTRSSFKKMTLVEDDVGALWISPDRLVYWGDTEQFAITREQLVEIERRGDSGGTSMLAGITHAILHVRLPDGQERQIRLHIEGKWTLGHYKKAMDELAETIARWHGSATAEPAA